MSESLIHDQHCMQIDLLDDDKRTSMALEKEKLLGINQNYKHVLKGGRLFPDENYYTFDRALSIFLFSYTLTSCKTCQILIQKKDAD